VTRTAAALVCVVLAVAGCGDDDDASPRTTTSLHEVTTTRRPSTTHASVTTSTVAGGPTVVTAAPGVTTTAAPAAASTDPTALEPLLLDDAGPGLAAQPDGVGDTGPLDLEEAARDDGEPDGRDALVAAGFRRGYNRLFSDAGRPEYGVVLYLYEFSENTGAKAYRTRMENRLRREQVSRGELTEGPLPNVPGGSMFSGTKGDTSSAAAIFDAGPYLVHIIVLATDHSAAQTANTAAGNQRAQLPA
jgi:hypothetical protein